MPQKQLKEASRDKTLEALHSPYLELMRIYAESNPQCNELIFLYR